jgi:hypothetical protein
LQTRLEKAAFDNGFDREKGPEGAWLAFTSTRVRLEVWLSSQGGGLLLAAFSRVDVADALEDPGEPVRSGLPFGARAGWVVPDIPALDRLLRRAFQLARSLPDQPLVEFERRTVTLPRTTEAERLVVQRVGQDVFRAALLEYWDGRCAVTGLAVPELLRASHIKPWADCATDAERLDPFNGLLLAPHLDAVFDCGLMTVEDDGDVRVSTLLGEEARALLGLDQPCRVSRLRPEHRRYLPSHRQHVFRAGGSAGPPGSLSE